MSPRLSTTSPLRQGTFIAYQNNVGISVVLQDALWYAKTNRGLAKGRKASVFSDSCPEFDQCLSRSNPNAHSVESRCYAASKISHCGPLQFRF
jgi:hypothetical protein